MSGSPQPGPPVSDPGLQRHFGVADDMASLPLPPAPSARVRPQQRDFWLRLTTFVVLLGAILTILYAWFLAQPATVGAVAPIGPVGPVGPVGLSSFERVLVPLLAVVTVMGVMVLDRVAVLGVVLMLAGTAFGLAGGAMWLVPGTALGCIWAARRHRAARVTIGFLLLVPAVAAVFYGLMSALTVLSGLSARWFSPRVMAPATLGQALTPLEFLPLALLGAWLLVRPLQSCRI